MGGEGRRGEGGREEEGEGISTERGEGEEEEGGRICHRLHADITFAVRGCRTGRRASLTYRSR